MSNLVSGFVGKKEAAAEKPVSVFNADLERHIKDTRDALDSLLAAECLTCGRYLIDMITMPFDVDEKVRKEWEI